MIWLSRFLNYYYCRIESLRVTNGIMHSVLNHILLTVAILVSVLHSYGATATLLVGQTYQTEINSTGYHYIAIESITSSNPSVSTTKMGLVAKATINAYFPGESTITIRLKYQLYAGQSYQYRNQVFTLACNDTHISISPTTANVKVGESYQLAYGFNRTTYITPSITWSSSDENIATVSSSGLVLGKSNGNVTIYAKSNIGSNVATCSVKVSNSSSGDNDDPGTGESDTSWYDSSKSEFTLNSASQLIGLRDLVNSGSTFKNKTILLSEDIDVSSYNLIIPIGKNSTYPFQGTFNGGGHSITIKVNYNNSTSQSKLYYGLFGYISAATIEDLTLKGSITVEVSDMTTYCYIGAFAGYGDGGSINNCVNECSIKYTRSYTRSTGNEDFIGGFIGSSITTIYNCINKAEVECCSRGSSANTNGYYVGGICGLAHRPITNSSNYGYIKDVVLGDYDYYSLYECVGGIVGLAEQITILRCSNFGNILGKAKASQIGGLIGCSNGGIVCKESYVGKCDIRNNYSNSAYSGINVNAICGRSLGSDSYTSNYAANDVFFEGRKSGQSGNVSYSSSEMKTIEFANTLGLSYWLGVKGMYPIVRGSMDECLYYITEVSNILCTEAVLISNIYDIFGSDVKTSGFLITKDDGKESYVQCNANEFSATIKGLTPNRVYKVRWYAQNYQGKEYYGVYNSFTTKPINPITLTATDITTSSCKLEANIFYTDYSKCGFYVEQEGEETGFYIWDVNNDGEKYTCIVNNLKGDTEYNFFAVCEADGVNYEGNQLKFKTPSICTLSPTEFTDESVRINGEIGIEVNDVYFEYRSSSTPSVIESSEIKGTIDNSKVYAVLNNLIIDEIYKYRIVAVVNDSKLYGDWIEFKFQGPSGVIDCDADNNYNIIVYKLNGMRIDGDLNSLPSGIYIVKQGKSFRKVLIR